jgi:hypothetical protein
MIKSLALGDLWSLKDPRLALHSGVRTAQQITTSSCAARMISHAMSRLERPCPQQQKNSGFIHSVSISISTSIFFFVDMPIVCPPHIHVPMTSLKFETPQVLALRCRAVASCRLSTFEPRFESLDCFKGSSPWFNQLEMYFLPRWAATGVQGKS